MAEYKCHNFSGLELLPTSMLEKIIEQDLNQEAEYDQEYIDSVLELMLKRAKEENLNTIPEPQSVWNKLQQRIEDENNLGTLPTSPIPAVEKKSAPRNKHILRFVAVVAASIVLMFGAVITTQAFGISIFGMLPRWTDDAFYLENPQGEGIQITENTESAESIFGGALVEMGLPGNLAPTWIPGDYEFVRNERFESKDLQGIGTVFSKPGCEEHLVVAVQEHFDSSSITATRYEKSEGEPETYVKGTMRFYLFENAGTWVGVWSDGRFCIIIAGTDSKETTIAIINSIEG